MKKLDLLRVAFTWLLGYVLFDWILPIDSWTLRFWVTGSIVTGIMGLAIAYRLQQKALERARKLVDWTKTEHLTLIRWNQAEGIMSLLRVEPQKRRNLRLTEEIVCFDTIIDSSQKELWVMMEGIQITLDGKTILEDEGDGLLLKQEKVWLKIPDSDVVREFFTTAD